MGLLKSITKIAGLVGTATGQPWLTAAAGIGGSLLEGSAAGKGSKKAAQIQAEANAEAIRLQREAAARTERVMTPYSQEGAGARSFRNSLLGLPGSETPAQSGATASAGAFDPDRATLQQMLDNGSPALKAAVQKALTHPKSQFKGGDPLDVVRFHVNNFPETKKQYDTIRTRLTAENKAKTAPATAPTGPPAPTVRQQADKAMAESPWIKRADEYSDERNATADKFETDIWAPTGKGTYAESPWAAISKRATDDAVGDFRNDAAGNGALISGAALRGGAEVRARVDDSFFDKYLDNYQRNVGDVADSEQDTSNDTFNADTGGINSYINQINGVASTGFTADSNIASGGQTTANNVGNLTLNQGKVDAGAAVDKANATGGVLNDAAGWLGYIYGQKKPTTPSLAGATHSRAG